MSEEVKRLVKKWQEKLYLHRYKIIPKVVSDGSKKLEGANYAIIDVPPSSDGVVDLYLNRKNIKSNLESTIFHELFHLITWEHSFSHIECILDGVKDRLAKNALKRILENGEHQIIFLLEKVLFGEK